MEALLSHNKHPQDIREQFVACKPYNMRLRREACAQRQDEAARVEAMPLYKRRTGQHLRQHVAECLDCPQGRIYRQELEEPTTAQTVDPVIVEAPAETPLVSQLGPRPNWQWKPPSSD